MIQHKNGYRYDQYKSWEKRLHTPYDYESGGVMNKIVSNRIANTANPILRVLLSFCDQSLVYAMKFTDVLKNFKNYYWKNR